MNTSLGRFARALGALVTLWLCAATAMAQAPLCAPTAGGYLQPKQDRSDTLVVFVHGLGGHPINTWRAENEPPMLWPCLVRDSIDELRYANIYLLGYPTGWFGDLPSVKTASGSVVDILQVEMLKYPQVVIIGHSLGGLIIADALHRISSEPNGSQLLDRVRLIALFGTPGAPSALAAAVRRLSALNITVSEQVQSLAGDQRIDQVVDAWRRSPELQAVVRCFAEDQPVGSVWYMAPFRWANDIWRFVSSGRDTSIIVPRESAFLLCKDRGQPIPASDHFSIVKPKDSNHASHIILSKATQACVAPAKRPGPDRSLAGTPLSTATAGWLQRFAANAESARAQRPDSSEPAMAQAIDDWTSTFTVVTESPQTVQFAVPPDPSSDAPAFKTGLVNAYGLRQLMRSELLIAVRGSQLGVGEVRVMADEIIDGSVRNRLRQLQVAGRLEANDLVLLVNSARDNVDYVLLLGRSAIDSGSSQALRGFLRIERPVCKRA